MDIVFLDLLDWDYDVATPFEQPLGGSQSAACYLAMELARRGHRVTLCCQTRRPREIMGVRCSHYEQQPPKFWAQPFDALIAVGVPAERGPLIRPYLAQETPLILWTQHAFDQPHMQPLQDPALHRVWDAIVCVSDWHRTTVIEKFQVDPDRVQVLRNASAPAFESLFPSKESLSRSKSISPILAYTSTPYRGLDVLLQVFPEIRAAFPKTTLRIYSSMKVYQIQEKEDEYTALYQRCQSLPGVEYIGSLPQPRLAEALAAASILAYPNTYAETSCISVMEALAAGLFVVTSDLGALPETTLGFARLVRPAQGTRSPAAFVADYCAVLREVLALQKRDPHAFAEERFEQVRAVNAQCTWRSRAQQWEGAIGSWKRLASRGRSAPSKPSLVRPEV